MGARERLNSVYFIGILMVAAVGGGLTASWWIFFLVTIVLTLLSLHGGEIRLTSTRHSQRRPSHRPRR